MRGFLTTIYSVVLFLMVTTSAFAAKTSAAEAPNSPSLAASLAAQAQSKEVELAVLKAQVDDAKRFQDSMLATVWGALACIVTIAVLLVGYGSYATNKVYERDKVSLRHDFLNEAKESEIRLRAFLEKNQVDNKAELDVMLGKRTEGVRVGFRGEIASIRSDILSMQKNLKESDREKWLQKGVTQNALDVATDILGIALRIDSVYDISSALDIISSDITGLEEKQKANPKSTVDSYQVSQTVAALDAVKDVHIPMAMELKKRVLALRTGT